MRAKSEAGQGLGARRLDVQNGQEAADVEHLAHVRLHAAQHQQAAFLLQALGHHQHHAQPCTGDVVQRREVEHQVAGTAIDDGQHLCFHGGGVGAVDLPLQGHDGGGSGGFGGNRHGKKSLWAKAWFIAECKPPR